MSDTNDLTNKNHRCRLVMRGGADVFFRAGWNEGLGNLVRDWELWRGRGEGSGWGDYLIGTVSDFCQHRVIVDHTQVGAIELTIDPEVLPPDQDNNMCANLLDGNRHFELHFRAACDPPALNGIYDLRVAGDDPQTAELQHELIQYLSDPGNYRQTDFRFVCYSHDRSFAQTLSLDVRDVAVILTTGRKRP